MPVKVRNTQSDFTPAPEGLHRAVCCDVVDIGLQETPWGKKRKVELKWQIEERMDNGYPYLVSKRYGASLHPKATLRTDLESWRGKRLTDEEAEEYDLERLLGKNCQVNITHNKTESGTYANVKAIVPAPRGLEPLQVEKYKRVQDREGYQQPEEPADEPPDEGGYNAGNDDDEPPPLTDDDIPF